MSTAYNRFELLLTVVLPASYLGRKRNEFGPKTKKNETTKHIYGQKRNWPKISKPVIFGAENENDNEFWSLSTVNSGSGNRA